MGKPKYTETLAKTKLEENYFELDTERCGCKDCNECHKHYSYCVGGICACHDWLVEMPNRKCHQHLNDPSEYFKNFFVQIM
jgi:hypothetical protein